MDRSVFGQEAGPQVGGSCLLEVLPMASREGFLTNPSAQSSLALIHPSGAMEEAPSSLLGEVLCLSGPPGY